MIGAAMIFVGGAFWGVAIALALFPHLGWVGSAAVTGLILLLPPCIWAVVAGFRSPILRPCQPDLTSDSAAMTLLSIWVRDKPLLAVLGAALFGMAEVFLRRIK